MIVVDATGLVLGRLADALGIHQAYEVVALLLIGVFVIILVAGRRPGSHVGRLR